MLCRFKCAQCSSAFSSEAKLNTHLKSHANEKSFKCTVQVTLCTVYMSWLYVVIIPDHMGLYTETNWNVNVSLIVNIMYRCMCSVLLDMLAMCL